LLLSLFWFDGRRGLRTRLGLSCVSSCGLACCTPIGRSFTVVESNDNALSTTEFETKTKPKPRERFLYFPNLDLTISTSNGATPVFDWNNAANSSWLVSNDKLLTYNWDAFSNVFLSVFGLGS
jgi:hypothetical protein